MPESLCCSRHEISSPRLHHLRSRLRAGGQSGSGRRPSRGVPKQPPRLCLLKPAPLLFQRLSLYGWHLLRPGNALQQRKKLFLQRNLLHLRPICRPGLFLFPLPASVRRRLEDVKLNRSPSPSPKTNRQKSTKSSGSGVRSRRILIPLEPCPEYWAKARRHTTASRKLSLFLTVAANKWDPRPF